MATKTGPLLRRILFWSHLAAGVGAGILILIMSATGVLLTYEKQMIAWAAPAGQPSQAAAAGGAPPAAAAASADAAGMRAFMDTVKGWHRRLGGEANSLRAGLLDIANLVFVFILLSGLYLWLPPLWRWPLLRLRLWPRADYGGTKRRDYAWHHVLGAWMLVPLLLIAVSGVVFSYSWANRLVFAAFGEVAPQRNGPPRPAIMASVVDIGAGQPATGAMVTATAAPVPTPGQRARRWLRFIHTGEVYGVAGQTVAGLASLAACVLVYTGLALAGRRLAEAAGRGLDRPAGLPQPRAAVLRTPPSAPAAACVAPPGGNGCPPPVPPRRAAATRSSR